MARSVRLRRWQKAALERFEQHDGPDFLAVATPGAGKTTFALTAVRRHLASHPRARVVVVAPTQHLKSQWATAAARFDLHLEPAWSSADGRLPADMHGIVTTYQQVAASAASLRALSHDAFVVFDEVHHAADERAWGDGIRHAFEPAARRLSLSGTPFRSDTVPIPFVRYELEEAHADFEYGYGDALRDGRVVRPVWFPRTNGHMEWTAPDGTFHSSSFDDPLAQALAGQRLRTALSLDGDWLPTVLAQAHRRLVEIRAEQPDAAGLVVAIDQDHARGIARLLEAGHGVRATVATSDDPTASDRIAGFVHGTSPWIVAVRMVSEGVDIPRLRVGVFATTTTTELFFRQAVGRLVRWTGGGQSAHMYIPDDPRLRARAVLIAEQRRHSLRRADLERPAREPDEAALDTGEEEQLSLFAAISAVPLDAPDAAAHPSPINGQAGDEAEDDDESLTIDLAPAPVLGGAGAVVAAQGGTLTTTRREHKKALRESNADRARLIARLTGTSHAQVNAELNRLTGLRRITEATLDQLERRLRHAEVWLDRL